jgi:predicted ATPase
MFLERIQIKDYSKPGASLAFKNLDIFFERDLDPSIFVIAGLQGCGKTSLLKIIHDRQAQAWTNAEVSVDGVGEMILVLHDHKEGISNWRRSLLYGELLELFPPSDYQSLSLNRMYSLLGFLRTVKNSIVLLDNPDLGLHPDLQYKLCCDIAEIKNGNQIIVATHSTDFCEALTPAHVKVIG